MDTYARLSVSTSNKPFVQPDEGELLFTGWVKEDRMRISQRLRRPNHYVPLVVGRIESTTSGCILLLHYVLFPNTRWLVHLWTILLVIGSAGSYFLLSNLWTFFCGMSLLVGMHFIVRSNFYMQLKNTRELIRRVVS